MLSAESIVGGWRDGWPNDTAWNECVLKVFGCSAYLMHCFRSPTVFCRGINTCPAALSLDVNLIEMVAGSPALSAPSAISTKLERLLYIMVLIRPQYFIDIEGCSKRDSGNTAR